MQMIEAQCRCGAIGLNIAGEPAVQLYCHCDDCQSAHGAAYVSAAIYPARRWKSFGKAGPDGGEINRADALRGLRRVSIR